MASGKLSPRQKMINMMYLVLIALLALNVSKEVLNAFSLVGDAMKSSNESIQVKNEQVQSVIAAQTSKNANPFNDQLNDISVRTQLVAQELYDYIEGLRTTLKEKSGTMIDEETGKEKYAKEDDIDNGTLLLVEQKKGDELKANIQKAHDEYVAILEEIEVLIGDDMAADLLIQTMPLRIVEPPKTKGEQKDWKTYNFYHIPVVGVDVLLSKFQNDAITTESQILELLAKQIGADKKFKIEKLSAKVIAPKSYLPSGKEYTADIFISASFTADVPNEIFLGSLDMDKIETDSFGDFLEYESEDMDDIPLTGDFAQLEEVSGGVGKYVAQAAGVGEKTYSGVIRVKQPTGTYKFYPFEASYEVAPPSGFAISPTKMNVLYIGVPNPLKISVSGAKTDADVSASISGGSMSRSGSEWIANVSTIGEATISVSAKIDGDMKSIGSMVFRVKRIPDPLPTLGGVLTGGPVQPGTLKAQSGLVALLKDFDFDARFDVLEFEMIYSSKGEVFTAKATGPLLTQGMKDFMSRLQPKDIVQFQNIKVQGPDKQVRKLPPLAFNII